MYTRGCEACSLASGTPAAAPCTECTYTSASPRLRPFAFSQSLLSLGSSPPTLKGQPRLAVDYERTLEVDLKLAAAAAAAAHPSFP